MSKLEALSSGTEYFLNWKKTNNPSAFFKTTEYHQRNIIQTEEEIKMSRLTAQARKARPIFHQPQSTVQDTKQKEAPAVGRGYCSIM